MTDRKQPAPPDGPLGRGATVLDQMEAFEAHEQAKGEYWIWHPVVSLTYELEAGWRFRVCLKVLGREVACGTVEPGLPLVLAGEVKTPIGRGRASVTISLEGTSLVFTALAGYRLAGGSWDERTITGVIVTLGQIAAPDASASTGS
jgi:hypothetical protein